MGRKSKLTDQQWAEVSQKLIDGQLSQRAIAREYGISDTTLREYIAKAGRSPTVQKVAAMLVETEAALKSLPIAAQVSAQNLAAKLRAISGDLASAAMHGAATAHHLAALANSKAITIRTADKAPDIEALKSVAAMTRVANEAALPALSMLAANRETMRRIEDEGIIEEKETPVRPVISREEWLQQHGLS